MRIDVRAEGFQFTPQLRALTESRLLSALCSFREQIESVAVHLRTRIGRTQSDTNSCDVVVRLYPSGEVRARAEKAQMEEAIARAAAEIRVAVEHAISQADARAPIIGNTIGHQALEIVLDDNRISHHLREMLERPENYLRPIVVREYWRPSEVEHEQPTEVPEDAFLERPLTPADRPLLNRHGYHESHPSSTLWSRRASGRVVARSREPFGLASTFHNDIDSGGRR